jgi:hypothetical protein
MGVVMALGKSMLISAALLVGATLVANAQAQYQAYPNNQVAVAPPYNPAPVIPPSWYYDPYTSGLGPCPQRYQADPPCREVMEPSYGQPSYWSR